MRTHLLRPQEVVPMCRDMGTRQEGWRVTTRPEDVDCITCRRMYESNINWWWHNTWGFVPPAAHFSHMDSGFPNLFLTLVKG